MQTATIETSSDEQIVESVRGGNAERYRELVERYERRVYAVAWSRLGDPHLAEEATQEAFIRGYRHLGLLNQGGKFGPWISTIARRVAINLGFRHRRELDKRERWALEQNPEPSGTGGAEPVDFYTPETLRRTLAELPNAHRECLVLFYLEGKSGAEAAAALGITETAFRVRLHRARGVLREQLEGTLESSLQKLHPAKSVVPAVMAVILISSSTAKAAAGGTMAVGAGTKLLSVLGKSVVFAWLIPFISVIGVLPGLVFAWWLGGMERRNYRETDGFRARLHRGFFHTVLWGVPLMIVLVYALTHSIQAKLGSRGMFLCLGAFMLVLTLYMARLLSIQRNPFQIGMFVYSVIITAGVIATALGWIPMILSQLPSLFATFWLALLLKYRPMRMDYSLFLRAARGLLKATPAPEAAADHPRFDRRALLAFARVLGSHWLAMNFRWRAGGLALRLYPVKTRFFRSMTIALVPMGRGCSSVLLGWDGTVVAHCGKTDAVDLAALMPDGPTRPRELEPLVANVVSEAWRESRRGDQATAARMLGELPDQEVFVVPPSRARATRWWQLLLGSSLLVAVATLAFWFSPREWFSRLKPVSINESQVRAFLNDIKTNSNPRVWLPNSPTAATFQCLVFPSTNSFSPNALRVMREEIFRDQAFDPRSQDPWKPTAFCNSVPLHRAMIGGWIGWDDVGLEPQEVTRALHQLKYGLEDQFKWDSLLTHGESWSWVKQERFKVRRLNEAGFIQLRWLRDMNSLDLVDREKLIQAIVPVQVLSGDAPPGQPPIHDWHDARGLFFTPGWPALHDTYYSVATLELLGGLDKMDREACIRGILQRHRGKGFFDSPDPGGYNEYKIEGDARDTFCAFETLRILGALDRVKDLDQWQFRPHQFHNAQGQLTWHDIEAWVCGQRFERFLRERKENPQAPPRSLFEP